MRYEVLNFVLDAIADKDGGQPGFLFVGKLPAFTEEFQRDACDVPFMLLSKNPYALVCRKVCSRQSLLIYSLNCHEFADFNTGAAHGACLGNESLAVAHLDRAEGASSYARFAGGAGIG